MRRILLSAGFALLLAACASKPHEEPTPVSDVPVESAPTQVNSSPSTEQAKTVQATPDQLSTLLPEGATPGQPVDVEGVSILPILDASAPGETDYLTLDEALQAGLCTVVEQNDVNALRLTNNADKPLFLMVGDLVLGGDQDRIMAESTIVEAGAKDLSIPVFCVEPHRWSAEQGREGAEEARFYARDDAKQVDVTVKKAAVLSGSQAEVWDAVGRANSMLAARQNVGGSYRSMLDDAATAKKLEELFDHA